MFLHSDYDFMNKYKFCETYMINLNSIQLVSKTHILIFKEYLPLKRHKTATNYASSNQAEQNFTVTEAYVQQQCKAVRVLFYD